MTGSRDKAPVYDPQNESLPSTPADSEVVDSPGMSEQVAERLTGSGRFRESHNRSRQEAMKDPLFRQAEEDAKARSKELADKKRARAALRNEGGGLEGNT